jgi:hypothetical protein
MSRAPGLAVGLACLLLALSTGSGSAAAGWKRAPVVPKIDDASRAALVTTLRRGARLGNRADVFAKVGDSHTESAAFAQGMGCGRWSPGRFKDLMDGVRRFSARTLPGASTLCPVVNSFSRNSAAARRGRPAEWAVLPGVSAHPACAPEETPLSCEIRVTRPAYALILFGTNDVALAEALGFDPLPYFLANMRRIISTARRLGVAPIVSTIPSRAAASGDGAAIERLNAGLHRLARARRVPLVNLWRALNPLPNRGLSSDGLHLSVFGGPECTQVCDPSTCAPACRPASFTRAGLRHGYNVRNRITAALLTRLAKLSESA